MDVTFVGQEPTGSQGGVYLGLLYGYCSGSIVTRIAFGPVFEGPRFMVSGAME